MKDILFGPVCWSRVYRCCSELTPAETVLFFLRFVLSNPYMDCDSDVVNMESAMLYRVDRRACFVRAKEWIQEFAI